MLKTVARMKLYLVGMACALLAYLLSLPTEELTRVATTMLGLVICLSLWLMQRLLGMITRLDFELTQLVGSVSRSLTHRERSDLLKR